MSNPNTIYQLSRRNPVIYHCLQSWEQGRITWEDALMHMAQGLETQYRTVVKENNLKEYIEEKTRFSSNYELPILEKSLIPKVDELPPLLRQIRMIEAIVLILEFHSNVLNLAVAKSECEPPKIIVEATKEKGIKGWA